MAPGMLHFPVALHVLFGASPSRFRVVEHHLAPEDAQIAACVPVSGASIWPYTYDKAATGSSEHYVCVSSLFAAPLGLQAACSMLCCFPLARDPNSRHHDVWCPYLWRREAPEFDVAIVAAARRKRKKDAIPEYVNAAVARRQQSSVGACTRRRVRTS